MEGGFLLARTEQWQHSRASSDLYPLPQDTARREIGILYWECGVMWGLSGSSAQFLSCSTPWNREGVSSWSKPKGIFWDFGYAWEHREPCSEREFKRSSPGDEVSPCSLALQMQQAYQKKWKKQKYHCFTKAGGGWCIIQQTECISAPRIVLFCLPLLKWVYVAHTQLLIL